MGSNSSVGFGNCFSPPGFSVAKKAKWGGFYSFFCFCCSPYVWWGHLASRPQRNEPSQTKQCGTASGEVYKRSKSTLSFCKPWVLPCVKDARNLFPMLSEGEPGPYCGPYTSLLGPYHTEEQAWAGPEHSPRQNKASPPKQTSHDWPVTRHPAKLFPLCRRKPLLQI